MKMDNSDEDTNGSFEIVDKVPESETDSDTKPVEESEQISDGAGDNNWEDVLGTGQLLKKVIKKGINDERPERLQICEIKYECFCDDKVVEKVDSMKIIVQDNEVIQGLDLIIPLMYIGEISEVKIGPRFAYGSKGLKKDDIEIPPDATLHYIIELLSCENEPLIEMMDVETRKKMGMTKKNLGNWWFSREDYVSAKQCYKRAVEYLYYVDSDDEQGITKTEANQLIDELINVYNNLAAVHLKTENMEEALQSVEKVLQLKPNNVKALFRKGKALSAKGERKEALKYFRKAIEIEPNDKQMLTEMQKLQNLIVADTMTERTLYKRMFEPGKTSKECNRSNVKNSWIKLGFFVGSLAVAVFGVVIYKYSGYN